MTGNLLIDSAISIFAIALMVLAARLAFGKPSAVVSLAAAEDRLAFDEPDFAPVDWLVDTDANGALARNERGEVAILFARGDGIVTRRFAAGAVKAGIAGNSLVISRIDHVTPELSLQLSEGRSAEAWMSLFDQGSE